MLSVCVSWSKVTELSSLSHGLISCLIKRDLIRLYTHCISSASSMVLSDTESSHFQWATCTLVWLKIFLLLLIGMRVGVMYCTQ